MRPSPAPSSCACAGFATTDFTKATTSSRRIRCFGPVPVTRARSTPSSRANWRTDGDACGLSTGTPPRISTGTGWLRSTLPGPGGDWEGSSAGPGRSGSGACRASDGALAASEPGPGAVGAGAAGLGSGAGAAGAGAGPGAGTGFGAAAPCPSPGCAAACPSPSSTTSTLPSETLSPTLTRSSTTRPAADDGISIDAFSLSTVTRLCSRPISSPSDTSTSMTSTSSKSPMSGTRTSIALIVLVSGSCIGGIGLVGVDPVLLDDRGDRFGRQRPLVDELAHRRQHDEVAIDLEMPPQAPAKVRPAEAVGTQHPVGAPLGNERADLVGEELGVVRGGDDGARGVREQPRHVGHPRLVTGMQQVVALAGQAVPAQLREAGRAPDVGRNAPVALEEIGRRDHFAQDRARTEQLR